MIQFINDIILPRIKSTTPFSMIINGIIMVVFLGLGIYLFRKENADRVWAWVCIIIAILAVLGIISNFLVTYVF